MGTLHCFKHPQYEGKESPILSCKMCCGIFVAALKMQREAAAVLSENKKPESIDEWFAEKRRAAQTEPTKNEKN